MLEQDHEIFFRIAASDRIRLDAHELSSLRTLLEQGWIQKLETPKQEGLEAQYQSLQESHGQYQEAKTLLDRIQARLEPKSRLGGLLQSSQAPSLPEDDPELLKLHTLLESLGIKLRNLEGPSDIPAQLAKLKERLAVDSRHCLDRMGTVDREIDANQKSTAVGILVESEGYFALTAAGTQALPEHQAMQELDSFFMAVSGPRKQKIEDYSHFRQDPASFLALFMECMRTQSKPSEVVLEFEALSEAYEKVSLFSEIRSFRLKNAFLMRLMRNFREDPKLRYQWCNRERLMNLLGLVRPLLPDSFSDPGVQLLCATDLLLARSGTADPLGQEALRLKAFGVIRQRLSDGLAGVRLGEGPAFRLALAMLHSALAQNFAGSALLERYVKQMLDATQEGSRLAPKELPDLESRYLFGFHLAHLAGLITSRLGPLADKVALIDAALLGDGRRRRAPAQVVVHALLCLERLERMGMPISPREYADTFSRIRTKLHQHKGIARALRAESVPAEDDAFLAGNLTARSYFAKLPAGVEGKKLLDVGVAGSYEPREPSCPPLLGMPFGTLMLT